MKVNLLSITFIFCLIFPGIKTSYSQYNHSIQTNVVAESISGGSSFKEYYTNSIGGNLSYSYLFESDLSIGAQISYNTFDNIIKEADATLSFTSFQTEIGYQIFVLDNLILIPKFALGYSWFNLEGKQGQTNNPQHFEINDRDFIYSPIISLVQLFEENYGVALYSSYKIVQNDSRISFDDSFEWFEFGGGLFYRF